MTQTYISPAKTFSLEYPDDWKLEKDFGEIVLFKKGGLLKKDSLNLLRIKPLLSDKIISPQAYSALLNRRKREHNDLEVIEKSDNYVMNFHILKYRQEGFQNKEQQTHPVIQDFWELVINNRIFTCCFNAPQGEEETLKAKEERQIAETILHSIRLL
jgi:hypothetical protein